MQRDEVEFVVVGAGALGLSAARSLARRGRPVVVCEQATVGHAASGSKGSVRIFRLGYDHPAYVRLAMAARELWRQCEHELATELVAVTGQVTFGDDLDVLASAMAEAGASHELLSAPEVAARFPALDVGVPALFEPESGVIAADDYLGALRRVDGVELRPRTRVLELVDDGRRVDVVTETHGNRRRLRASAVIVCAGPWTAPLLPHPGPGLHPWPTLEQVAYLEPVARDGSVDHVPVFVERRQPWFYGLPDRSSGLVKVSLHGAGPAVALDRLEDAAVSDSPDAALVAELSACARRLLPGLRPEPLSTERCVYDNTPDGDFVLDRFGRVVVGSGTSGHGFKFAPLLGEMLADLATGAPEDGALGTAQDLGRFSADRPGAATGGGPTVHP